MKLATMFGREISGHSTCRAVHDDRSLAAREDMIGAQRERQFLTNVATGVIDDGQPVGIGILRKADIRAMCRHGGHQ